MLSKAVAVHSLFLVATMSLFLIFTLITLWFWIGQTPIEANKASCIAKYMNYCERWMLNSEDPGDWNDIEPKGCEDSIIGINKPTSIDDCNLI